MPTADQWNSLVDAVERFSRIGTTGSVEVTRAGNELNLHVRETEVWDAQIDAEGSGSGSGGACPAYSWHEVLRQGCNYVAGPRSGTLSTMPAHELNGSSTVAPGTIVRMWYAFDGQSTEFDRDSPPGGGSGSGSGAGNILVLTQQTCVNGVIQTTTYTITFPPGTTVQVS